MTTEERLDRLEDAVQTLAALNGKVVELLQAHGEMLQAQAEMLQTHGEVFQTHGEVFQAHTEILRAQEERLIEIRRDARFTQKIWVAFAQHFGLPPEMWQDDLP